MPMPGRPAYPHRPPNAPVDPVTPQKESRPAEDEVGGSPRTPAPAGARGRSSKWLLFNDFSITPTPPAEASALYGVQKLPVLLFYLRSDKAVAFRDHADAPPPIEIAASEKAFRALLREPPLAVRSIRPTFTPLNLDSEPIVPGRTILGIDAEFVALVSLGFRC